MVVTVSKNLLFVRPIYFPEKKLFVIAHENLVEVINIHHNIIWKLEEKSKIKNLDYCDISEAKFYVALEHGEIKLCDINKQEVNVVIRLENEIQNVFYFNRDVIIVEKESINLYYGFDNNNKKLISDKTFKHIAFCAKLGIIGIVENLTVSVICINDNKSFNYKVIKRSKVHYLTAVACHPSEPIIATGETTGKIYIWWDVNTSLKRFTVYHWHFLSLKTLEFSYNGEYLFSGGHEQVLVRWEFSVTEHKKKQSCYPRLESDIESIRSCVGTNSEYFLITLSDNSIRILGDHQGRFGEIDSYSGLIQRPLTLHNKVSKSCQLNPVGLRSCFNLPPKFSSCVLLNGHEGKLQFYDLNRRSTEYQLDVACQNWPTESENYFIPGFIQVQLVTISNCGRFIATCESLGVCKTDMSGQQMLRVFIWSEDNQSYELETKIDMDCIHRLSDMVFHPVDNRYLACTTIEMELLLFQRNINSDIVCWDMSNSVDLEEVLYRFQIKMENVNSKARMVTVEKQSRKGDGLLVVTKCDCIVFYHWSDLIESNTKPVFAVQLETLVEDLDMKDEDKKLLNSTISSVAVFNHDVALNTYRIILGLPTGLIVIEMLINSQGVIEYKAIAGAISKFGVKSLKSYPVSLESNSQVAVLFENSDHLTIISVWNDASVNNKIVSVPALDDVAWVPVNGQNDNWVLVGIRNDSSMRSIVVCDDEAPHFTQTNAIEIKQETKNLLSSVEEIHQLPKKEKTIRRNLHNRLDRSFLLYDPISCPSATLILNSLYAI